MENIRLGLVLDENQYHRYALKYGTIFEASIGAEAMYTICRNLDLGKLENEIRERLTKAGAQERHKLGKRLGLVRGMRASGVRPEWMFLTIIPVIPPGIRPMVALEGGRHATSDVNDLYRRVINRNNRLQKLKKISAPDVILRNGKRILQEAVDALLDNSMRRESQTAMLQSQRRALKSIADNLKGKQGYFRQNLLGKRVDYSGRSVIVIGPHLKLGQCGLPKHMALELFKPFVIAKLLERELAYNIRGASRLIEEGISEVWAILEEVTKGKRVLLNRAPTLHRLGIQAFQPVLIEGNAIQVHPLVCTAFNADFDGDQMAVHVPLSDHAQKEAEELMASNKNLLSPGSGNPIVNPSQDIVLGVFWMTKMVAGDRGEGKYFQSPNSAITSYDFSAVGFRAKILVRGTGKKKYEVFGDKPFETTVGRLLFNAVLPEDFPYINKEVKKKDLAGIVNDLITTYGIDATPAILDKIKTFGFRYATISGITWSISDIRVPEGKKALVEKAKKEVMNIDEQFNEGLLSDEERRRKTIEIWQEAKDGVEKLMPGSLPENGPVSDMIVSGARGTVAQLVQMAGMKGLIQNTAGQIIDFPIVPSYKEGLSPLEYFVTTHGSRKGLADTALNTARAGYLTRRLVYVADSSIILEEDCGAKEGRIITRKNVSGFDISLAKNAWGRFLAKEVTDAKGKTLFSKGHFLSRTDAQELEDEEIDEITVRSPLACRAKEGLCQKCYGIDLGRNKIVSIGEPVGIVAAQAIGEPGTQLTMRTFHTGGVAGADITMGLPRVEEIFEKRTPKSKAVIAVADGMVLEVKDLGKEKVVSVLSDDTSKPSSARSPELRAGKKKKTVEYSVSAWRVVLVKAGQNVTKGDIITDGSADIEELYKYAGREKTEVYIINEITKIYELQGATISRKHIEVIIRQMFSRVRVKDAGDTRLSAGGIVEESVFLRENTRVAENGGAEAKGEELVLGITDVSLTTKSFLSSASFQHTSRILIDVSVRGVIDHLSGLKENVIIGRLIPAGTGLKPQRSEEEGEE